MFLLSGKHNIDVTYDGIPLPGAPFNVSVKAGCDAKKCKAFGPGLDRGLVDKPNSFTVETKGRPHFSYSCLIDFLSLFLPR